MNSKELVPIVDFISEFAFQNNALGWMVLDSEGSVLKASDANELNRLAGEIHNVFRNSKHLIVENTQESLSQMVLQTEMGCLTIADVGLTIMVLFSENQLLYHTEAIPHET